MRKHFYFILLIFFSLFAKTSFADLTLNNEKELQKENFENTLPKVDFQKSFFKMMVSLAVIVVLSILTIWAFKRISRAKIDTANKQKAIKIIEKRALSPKSMLYLVDYEGKKVFISESQVNIKMKVLNKTNV